MTKAYWVEDPIDWQDDKAFVPTEEPFIPEKEGRSTVIDATTERRVNSGTQFRAAVEDGQRTLSGYAATYGTLSKNLGGKGAPWYERILPAAFEKTLRGKPDVRMTVNHSIDAIVGRTRAGTLSLASDSKGLSFRCILPDSEAGRSLHTSVMRGDLSDCSFGFNDADDSWDAEDYDEDDDEIRSLKRGTRMTVRNIRGFGSLTDVSCVAVPAYPGTSIQARSLGVVLAHPPEMHDTRSQRIIVAGAEVVADLENDKRQTELRARQRRVYDQLMGL